jgi:hypothetical protein
MDIGFNILARDKGASAAFEKVSKSIDGTTAAMAKVEKATDAVAVASTRLQKAQSTEADAIGKVRVAESKLEEIRKNGKAKASQIAAAEETLAAAQRKAASAADSSRTASKRYSDSQAAAAKAAKELGDAQEAAGKKSKKQSSDLEKVGKVADSTDKKFGFLAARTHGLTAGISTGFGRAAGALAAFAGVAALKGFIDDARESAKVGRLTEAVIKSTGGSAKITADQVGDLATAISNKTGADDEAIQSGSNLLLTFTNIRNGVGKGNQIFDQATQAVTDMTAALNDGQVTTEGIKTSSIQLGKALNDPIKGVTALQKVGVSFTADQKKQIKTLVDSGKTMQAQKIILGELNKEFGGAAAAAADPMQKLGVIVGNAKEAIGGAFLPIVDKAATILGRVIPAAIGKASIGFSALNAAFHGEGVTSSGFVGVMEHIGVMARSVANVFQSAVIPRIKDFGAWVVAVAGNLVATFGPAVKDVFGFFKTDVLPRLQAFARYLGTSVLPKVGELAAALSENKDFLVPFVATLLAGVVVFKAVTLAVKAWAAVQAILNVVLAANPIGLVIVGVAALVAGIIYAYKHSEKFRQILQGAFRGIQVAAQTFAPLVKAAINVVIGVFSLWWNVFAKPILTRFGAALATAWGLAKRFGQITAAGFTAIKEPARAAIAFVIGRFLGFVGDILTGASKAFGWVPKLGPKLKAAATEFGKFRDGVNARLAGIKDQTVNVGIKYSSKGVNLSAPSSVGRFADGGGVFGGTRGQDSVPALLMPDEHVWTTKEVNAAGGHGAMKRMRRAALAGELNGYAAGGAVGFHINTRTPSAAALGKAVAAQALKSAGPYIAAGAKQLATMGPSGPPGGRHSFRGQTLNSRTISMLLNAERLLGRVFHIMQGSYSTRVSASGSTHAGGGAMDTDGPGGWNTAVSALRRAGFAAWHRSPSQGPWGHHIHSIAIGDPSASPAAKAQVRSFLHGGNGLGGYKRGTPWVPNDQLAHLHKGEAVIPRKVNEARLKASGGGAQTVVLEFRSDGTPHMDWLVKEFRKYVRVQGGNVQHVLGTGR